MLLVVDPYLFPARGRKRAQQQGSEELPEVVDPYLFPARGRKRWVPGLFATAAPNVVDPYLFPARGRKPHHSMGTPSTIADGLIPTFSPQGDGNNCSTPLFSPWGVTVDPYLFPARGRKPSSTWRADEIRGLVLIPTFSPQGDGNMTFMINSSLLGKEVDPYLFPARGRKHTRTSDRTL